MSPAPTDTGQFVVKAVQFSRLEVAVVEVYLIKHLKSGNVVAAIEAQSDVSHEQALIHWLASCGLTEKAVSQFRCIFAPVIPWASLAKMFEPIAD